MSASISLVWTGILGLAATFAYTNGAEILASVFGTLATVTMLNALYRLLDDIY